MKCRDVQSLSPLYSLTNLLYKQAANVAVLDYEFGAVTSPERKKVDA